MKQFYTFLLASAFLLPVQNFVHYFVHQMQKNALNNRKKTIELPAGNWSTVSDFSVSSVTWETGFYPGVL